MQTLTIRVDESCLEQILNFLQQIPTNKLEIFQGKKLNISSTLLKNRQSRWDKIDSELRNLKTLDINAGEELKEALTLVGKGVKLEEYKSARDEYLNGKSIKVYIDTNVYLNSIENRDNSNTQSYSKKAKYSLY